MNLLILRIFEISLIRKFLGLIPVSWKRKYYDRRTSKIVPVLVYTMGKVASSSIYLSLYRQYGGIVLFGHNIYEDHDDWRLDYIYRRAIYEKKPIKIISLTREPIGRNISAFFQTFERNTGFKLENATFSHDELFQLFLETYDHDLPLKWFQLRLQKVFGVDVYSTPFPQSGASVYTHENIQVLVMRSELDDSEKATLICQFLETKDFHLENENVSSQKNYSSMYEQFKNKIKLPPEYINKMCESKYFNHFYPPEMIEVVRKRWEN